MQVEPYVFYLFILFSCLLSIFSKPVFPKGHFREGKCVIKHSSNVSFLWDIPHSNSFYTIIPLEEKEYSWQAGYDNRGVEHFLPEQYLRYLGEQFYHEKLAPFPDLRANYSILWNNATLRYAFFDNLYFDETLKRSRLMAVFSDVYSTDRGLIVHPVTCEYVRNGGCVYMIHSSDFGLPGVVVPHYDKVISLTSIAF
jgi:hypothetical protein